MKSLRTVWLAIAIGISSACFATQWTVTVTEFEFIPPSLTVQLGDTVNWVNVLGIHNVVEACGTPLFANSVQEAPWQYSFAFSAANGVVGGAVYPYYCEVHPDVMWGKISVVRPPQRWNVTLVSTPAFNPANITVVQGDTVVWTNPAGVGVHNVRHIAGTPLFNSGNPASGPWTYSFVFALPPALYNYQCTLHGGAPFNMRGSVTVTAGASPTPTPAGLVIRSNGSDANLNWFPVAGATCYLVSRSQTPDPSPFTQLITVTPDTFYTVFGAPLISDKSFYQVSAINN